MTFISIASSFAIVLGFAGTIPHIATMVRTRSSAGQSPTGWFIGIAVNVMTGYVNLAGVGDVELGIGNVLAGTFALIALLCVVHFRRGTAAAVAPAPAPEAVVVEQPAFAPAVRVPFHELPTGELTAIKVEVDREHARRENDRAEQLAAHEADVERVGQDERAGSDVEPAYELDVLAA
ncbi:MAG TPA: hypothetical protein VGM91_21995 [Conexibacter sp.]|jgi:hypothetical protein